MVPSSGKDQDEVTVNVKNNECSVSISPGQKGVVEHVRCSLQFNNLSSAITSLRLDICEFRIIINIIYILNFLQS